MNGKWHPIEPLDSNVEEQLRGDLAVLNTLHGSWKEFADSLAEDDRSALRRRTLRKQAIETGIIERLYSIDWGVTETLVAEGLTREAMARAGGDPEVVPMLQAQMEGLEMVADYVRNNQPLTTSFVKELHALITRTQQFYDATDTLGRPATAKLEHGKYKTLANNVRLPDGSLLEFSPPEQVDGEIERLVEWYNQMNETHPIVSAAWLHHRFVQIHPFQDGNGRVARALTLLSLGKRHYPPLVVDRNSRDDYLNALDIANNGDLTPLGKLFARLATRSIRSELQEPPRHHITTTAKETARAFSEQLKQKRIEEAKPKERAVLKGADQLHRRIRDRLAITSGDLGMVFAEGGTDVQTLLDDSPPHEGSRAWRDSILRTAQQAGYKADLSNAGWTLLRFEVDGFLFRLVISIHHVGSRRTGVMAMVSFADSAIPDGEAHRLHTSYVQTCQDAFTFTQNEDLEDRSEELNLWLDESLAVALRELMNLTLGN